MQARLASLPLQQFPELLLRKSGVTHDPTHRVRVDWVVARDGENAGAVGHHNMLSLSKHSEARLLQSSDSVFGRRTTSTHEFRRYI